MNSKFSRYDKAKRSATARHRSTASKQLFKTALQFYRGAVAAKGSRWRGGTARQANARRRVALRDSNFEVVGATQDYVHLYEFGINYFCTLLLPLVGLAHTHGTPSLPSLFLSPLIICAYHTKIITPYIPSFS